MSVYGKTHTSRRLVQGRGVYDAPTNCQRDPLYKIWHGMFGRCYGARSKANMCYVGCEVDPIWYSFVAFKEWAESHNWTGKQLDKDLLVPSNKIYGPKACCFIPQYVNLVITKLDSDGFAFKKHKKTNPYEVLVHGVWLGAFDTAKEASLVWRKDRANKIEAALSKYLSEGNPDPRVVNALNRVINQLTAQF